MQNRQKQVLEAYLRVQEFLNAHPVQPPFSYAQARQDLDGVVAALKAHRDNQLAGIKFGRAERKNQGVVMRELREKHMLPLTAIARAKLAGSPGIDEVTKMPRANASPVYLIGEGNAFLKAAQLYKEVFIANGRPQTFAEDLAAAIQKVEVTMTSKTAQARVRTGASQGLASEVKQGRKAVEVLSAIVKSAFFDSPDVLAEWRSARLVHVLPGASAAPQVTSAPEVKAA